MSASIRSRASLVLVPALTGTLLLATSCSSGPPEPDRSEVVREDLIVLRDALERYARDHGGAYPESLTVLVRPDEEGRHYLPGGTPATYDPWGQAYVYETGKGSFSLTSLGADRAAGGSGANADLDLSLLEAGE